MGILCIQWKTWLILCDNWRGVVYYLWGVGVVPGPYGHLVSPVSGGCGHGAHRLELTKPLSLPPLGTTVLEPHLQAHTSTRHFYLPGPWRTCQKTILELHLQTHTSLQHFYPKDISNSVRRICNTVLEPHAQAHTQAHDMYTYLLHEKHNPNIALKLNLLAHTITHAHLSVTRRDVEIGTVLESHLLREDHVTIRFWNTNYKRAQAHNIYFCFLHD